MYAEDTCAKPTESEMDDRRGHQMTDGRRCLDRDATRKQCRQKQEEEHSRTTRANSQHRAPKVGQTTMSSSLATAEYDKQLIVEGASQTRHTLQVQTQQ